MFQRLLLLLLVVTSSPYSLACECLWQGAFNKIITKADLIVTGKILVHKGNAADFEIASTLKGQEYNPIIRLWGNTGNLCRPNLTDFADGTEWLLALHRINDEVPGGFNPNTPNISYGRIGDYALSNCGVYWLKYDYGLVTGNLINGQRWQYNNDKMSPVRIEIIERYINDTLSDDALIEAAKPQADLQQLMRSTKHLLLQ